MVKVITYGTYDLLHYGHIRLLERAKALGDFLIVGVTADDFDKTRGKINVQQSLMERIEAVRATGLADKIIVEEYEGQKIDDIRRYDVDIFTVGSDWVGKFDYLNEYCKVVYLDRTQGISSSEIRSKEQAVKLGLIGENLLVLKHLHECGYVNGVETCGVYTCSQVVKAYCLQHNVQVYDSYEELLDNCDAVYIASIPRDHYQQISQAIEKRIHVLCESPITLSKADTVFLLDKAKKNKVVLMESIKTAYSTAYDRLLLLIKSGKIGKVVSVDAVCTSLKEESSDASKMDDVWSGFEAWVPTALLPVYQILGTDVREEQFITSFYPGQKEYDQFTHISIRYDNAIANVKVGTGIKSEGHMVIAGTKGYIYVPAPWWKTDYFEIRYENQTENRRYFYQLDGEGIRFEEVSFVKEITSGRKMSRIDEDVTLKIADTFQKYRKGENVIEVWV